MDKKSEIQRNISAIIQRISQAAVDSGRDPETVGLVVAGKTQPIDNIRHAIDSGAIIIGENYVQEAREKFNTLSHLKSQWHFIGHLQSNKAKYAVRMFDLIHSVDSIKLARELDKHAHKVGKKQQILIQVNISGETTKSGTDEKNVARLAQDILGLENIHLRGLMTMPPFFNAPEMARPYFSTLRLIRNRIEDQLGINMRELSMGMTGDFEVAIKEGATLVRIGTALFGKRQ